jgi:hypothetical protein
MHRIGVEQHRAPGAPVAESHKRTLWSQPTPPEAIQRPTGLKATG